MKYTTVKKINRGGLYKLGAQRCCFKWINATRLTEHCIKTLVWSVLSKKLKVYLKDAFIPMYRCRQIHLWEQRARWLAITEQYTYTAPPWFPELYTRVVIISNLQLMDPCSFKADSGSNIASRTIIKSIYLAFIYSFKTVLWYSEQLVTSLPSSYYGQSYIISASQLYGHWGQQTKVTSH